jgi:hypothetical protein
MLPELMRDGLMHLMIDDRVYIKTFVTEDVHYYIEAQPPLQNAG